MAESKIGRNVSISMTVIVGLLSCVIGLQRGGLMAADFVILGMCIVVLGLLRGRIPTRVHGVRRILVVALFLISVVSHFVLSRWQAQILLVTTVSFAAVLLWPAARRKRETPANI